MSDEKVPEKMRGVYDEIIALTDAVCIRHLSQEYADLSRRMAAALSRKRPSPLASGKAKQIRDALKIHLFDHRWLVSVNGFIVDIRQMPRPIQEEAYRKGIFPYIPDDSNE